MDEMRTDGWNPIEWSVWAMMGAAKCLHGTALDSAVSKVTTAYERCVRADQCVNEEDLAGMHKAYGQVFGDYYPV
jgi:hypothetical protein